MPRQGAIHRAGVHVNVAQRLGHELGVRALAARVLTNRKTAGTRSRCPTAAAAAAAAAKTAETSAAAEAVGYRSIGVEKDEVNFDMAANAIPKLAAYDVRQKTTT